MTSRTPSSFPPGVWVVPLSASPHCICCPHIGHRVTIGLSHCLLLLVSKSPLFYLIVPPKCKTSEAGNLDVPKRSHKVYVCISHDTIQVLEENIGRKISDIPRSNIFTTMSPRERDIKERINKWDLIKIKSFCIAKENSIKMKREPTVWENVFANDTSDKGLISKICKELTQLHSRKTKSPIKKWAKDLNRHLSNEDIQRAQRYMKGCSASLVIREMQIKTTMRYHFIPVRMAMINKSVNNKY